MDRQTLRVAHIARALVAKAQTDAPNYRAHSVPQVHCETCAHFVRDTECELFGFAADPDYVCDRYEGQSPDVGQ